MLCSSVSVPYLMSNCFNAEQEQGREHDGNACDRNLMSATFNEGEHPHPSPLTPSALVLERLGPQGPLSLSLSLSLQHLALLQRSLPLVSSLLRVRNTHVHRGLCAVPTVIGISKRFCGVKMTEAVTRQTSRFTEGAPLGSV